MGIDAVFKIHCIENFQFQVQWITNLCQLSIESIQTDPPPLTLSLKFSKNTVCRAQDF